MGLSARQQLVQGLVDAHYESLYRYGYRLSGSSTEAEDLTQETFCKAQQNLHQLRDATRARAWLFRILRNVYLQRARSGQQHRWVSLDSVGDLAEPLPDSLPAVDPERLQQALNDLPEDFRTPIILFYFEEFSYRDIADHMDLPLGTVMSRLARAKAHLRTRLLERDPAVAADGPGRATHGL